MPTNRSISYKFNFEKVPAWNYVLTFDQDNSLIPSGPKETRSWTKLEFCKCSHCPLNEKDHPQCPVARNIDNIVEDSKDVISYTDVEVTVTTPEREYVKKCAAQNGLVSLFGLIMATSGCPHLNWLKPLARFHLPFATMEETLFRVLSLQMLTEFFTGERKQADESAEAIKNKYAAVGVLNHCFIARIRNYCKGDADKNAIAALDIWVQAFELFKDDDFSCLESIFTQQSTKGS